MFFFCATYSLNTAWASPSFRTPAGRKVERAAANARPCVCVCAKSTGPSSDLPLRRRDAPAERGSPARECPYFLSVESKPVAVVVVVVSHLTQKGPDLTSRERPVSCSGQHGTYLSFLVSTTMLRWTLLRSRSARSSISFSLPPPPPKDFLSLPLCQPVPPAPARLLIRSNPSLPLSLLAALGGRGRGWLRCALWVGGLLASSLACARCERSARAQSASLKGFSPACPVVPLVPPRRATLADAAAERGASRRPCRRRPPTRRAQGPIALLHTRAHTP